MQKIPEKKDDTAPASTISQKEYLQKYLMKGKGKKVKKKKPKISSSSHIKRSIIIDDDVDLNNQSNVDEEGFNLDYMGDEAPQVCGYTDDRPIEIQLKEKFSTGHWKSIGDMESEEEARRDDEEAIGRAMKDQDIVELSPPRKKLVKRDRKSSGGNDSDLSPPRKAEGRKKGRYDAGNGKVKGDRGRQSDSDLSPPRKGERSRGRHIDSKSKENDSDLSPPRKKPVKSKRNDSDLSPPRKHSSKKRDQSVDSDLSPPRRSSRSVKNDKRRRRDSDSDLSPQRRSDNRSRNPDARSPRGGRDRGRIKGSDSDLSPPRRGAGRRSDMVRRARDDANDSDLSPPRRTDKKGDNRREKLDKTLDGKTAGLQNARRLKEELKALKDKEDRMFKKLDASLLGKSAAPVMRDRKTGQKRDLEKEKQAEREKAEKAGVRKNKYDRWGRGLKQVREREEQMADMIHEMSKPLARYKDDQDLDRLLKSRDREGDPMLEYIRNKQEESHVVDLTVDGSRPKYRGNFMPNRFDIPPGHRWDGVDRSNGYEQKWFEAKSAKVAVEEEAWKWSSADM